MMLTCVASASESWTCLVMFWT